MQSNRNLLDMIFGNVIYWIFNEYDFLNYLVRKAVGQDVHLE